MVVVEPMVASMMPSPMCGHVPSFQSFNLFQNRTEFSGMKKNGLKFCRKYNPISNAKLKDFEHGKASEEVTTIVKGKKLMQKEEQHYKKVTQAST